MGLLEKAQQRKQEILEKTMDTEESTAIMIAEKPEPKVAYSGIKAEKGQQDIMDERKGFGWKGLGSRQIVFDHNISTMKVSMGGHHRIRCQFL